MKHCNKCNTTQENTFFYKDNAKKDGLMSECILCTTNRKRLYDRTVQGVISTIYSSQKRHSKIRGHGELSYSKKELTQWLFANDDFIMLFISWEKHNYDKMMKPSCDRFSSKDAEYDLKPYSLDRLIMVTWGDNMRHGAKNRKTGVDNRGNKEVIQKTIDGNFIDKFFSAYEATRRTGVPQQNISKCCNKKRKTAGGFTWEFSTLCLRS